MGNESALAVAVRPVADPGQVDSLPGRGGRASLTLRAEYAFVAVAAFAYLVLLGCYVASPAFKDHVEPGVGSVASALLRGEPPYHGMTGPR